MKTVITDKHEYENNLLARVIDALIEQGMEKFATALILTGSFGRDEATYVKLDDGTFELKSDVELALVVRIGKSKDAQQAIHAVCTQFYEELNIMPLHEQRLRRATNFNYTILPAKKKTVFTFDLYNGSKTIWGHDYISNVNITNSDIDLFEAKRIIANRIAESAYISATQTNKEQLFIWRCKHILALASAWLISNGLYVSSYHEQYNIMCDNETYVVSELGNPFFIQYEKAFMYLRGNGDKFDYDDGAVLFATLRMRELFDENNISKPKVNCFARKLKYAIKYIKLFNKFNISGMEERILNGIIDAYLESERSLDARALVWHEVLH